VRENPGPSIIHSNQLVCPGTPCGPPKRSSAVCMCGLVRIAAIIPSARLRPYPCPSIVSCERKEVKFYDPGSGLAEIFALAWVFIALVIGEVGLNILRWFTFGFDYAGNRLRPSTCSAGPSCKPRVFLKIELSARRCHDGQFPTGRSRLPAPWKFKLHHHPQVPESAP
jgi:hypothetical protein